MDILLLDGLPPQTRVGTILRLLIEEGGLNKLRIGQIRVRGSQATIEVAAGWAERTARRLDGATVETRRIRARAQASGAEDDAHFAQLRRWLALEAQAEAAQAVANRQRAAGSLNRLVIKAEEVGLGGRLLVRLAPRHEGAGLPWTPLGAGSPVVLSEEGSAAPGWRGVISRLHAQWVEVALNAAPEPEGDRPNYRLDPAPDDIARQRQLDGLARVAQASGDRLAELRDILLGHTAAAFLPDAPPVASDLLAGLNPSQAAAVRLTLAARDVAVIHGPPGTGKTTTLAAALRAAVRRGERVLVCAPSNLAVDNVCEQLLAASEAMVRLGHPARVSPALQAVTLDALVEQHADYRLAQKMRREAFGLRQEAGKWRRARPERGAKQALRDEAQALLAEARQLEASVVERVLDGAALTCATLTALDSTLLGRREFDLCAIDEAGQSTESAAWLAIARARRVVLAGDHQQLPPTILSPEAAQAGLGVTLLEQLMARDAEGLSRLLDVQYRMHEQIMGFSSAEFYAQSLHAAPSVRFHLLADLPGVAATALTTRPLTFIDTAGAGYAEELEPDGESRRNPSEAELVTAKVRELQAAGVDSADIGVITPYAAQVRLLRAQLGDDVEVNSVDGFQGREKEAIVISLVRANPAGEVGFLAEARRLNVALTRARRKLIIVGDSATVSADPVYARLLDYCEHHGAYTSVWDDLYA